MPRETPAIPRGILPPDPRDAQSVNVRNLPLRSPSRLLSAFGVIFTGVSTAALAACQPAPTAETRQAQNPYKASEDRQSAEINSAINRNVSAVKSGVKEA